MFEDGSPKGTAKVVPTIQRRRKQCASDTNFSRFTVFCYCDRVCLSYPDARDQALPEPKLRVSQDGVAEANFLATWAHPPSEQ